MSIRALQELVEAEGLAGMLAGAARVLGEAAAGWPVWSLSEAQVGEVIGAAQAVRAAAQTLTVVVAGEAGSRGLGVERGLSRVDWLRAVAPALEPGEAPAVARVAAALREPGWEALAAGVAAGGASVAQAAAILRFHDDVARVADPAHPEHLEHLGHLGHLEHLEHLGHLGHLGGIVAAMVEACEVLSVRELDRLAAHGRAWLTPPGQLDADDARLRAGRAFRRVGATAGFTEYRLWLDPEGVAIIEAAIDPLARPRPEGGAGSEGGAGGEGGAGRDPRAPATRRADALLEVVGRAVAAPEGVTGTPGTQLVVTMSLEALLGRVPGAGVCDDDAVLSPATVRRLACEATIVPAVLGAPSEVLDLGRGERFFTPGQRRALAVRDRGCSYPGCTIPPPWCQAHHVTHWADGGGTDLANGALLCGRHHTVVHQRDLTATVTTRGVTWHL